MKLLFFVVVCILAEFMLPISAAKIYLCGDSTMADNISRNRGSEMDGWGNYSQSLFDLPVINKAIGGRSARSYTREGRFQEVAKMVTSGDWIVIEFGHNDGGSVSPSSDNGRTDCPGTDLKSTCAVNYQGERTAKTFPAYLVDAGKIFVGKGAKVVMSSQTPNNVFESKSYKYSGSRFGDMTKDAAKLLGPDAFYVDHGAYTAKSWQTAGMDDTNKMFMPGDHTHTTKAGARLVARAFAKAVVCSKIPLAEHVKKITC